MNAKAAPTILTSQSQIADASAADLVATYNALTGKSIKKFESRGIAESRVGMAILGAEHDAGKAGVSKGEKPKAAPKADTDKKRAAAKADKPEAPAGKPVKTASGLTFAANSLASQLLTASASSSEKRAAAKSAPRAPAVRRPKGGADRMLVNLTEDQARSKLQADSNRAKIVAILRSAKKVLTVEEVGERVAEHLGAKDVDAALTKLANLGWVKMAVIEPK